MKILSVPNDFYRIVESFQIKEDLIEVAIIFEQLIQSDYDGPCGGTFPLLLPGRILT